MLSYVCFKLISAILMSVIMFLKTENIYLGYSFYMVLIDCEGRFFFCHIYSAIVENENSSKMFYSLILDVSNLQHAAFRF